MQRPGAPAGPSPLASMSFSGWSLGSPAPHGGAPLPAAYSSSAQRQTDYRAAMHAPPAAGMAGMHMAGPGAAPPHRAPVQPDMASLQAYLTTMNQAGQKRF
jgi:hypothetical protein